MVLHHVAQRARLLVIRPARLHADRLAHRDLYVVDVLAVPQRLEDAVGEAQDQDVLDGLLAEIVVDPVDLPLAEHPRDQPVQLLGALQVAAERLLDDDPRETVGAPREPRFAQAGDDRRVEARRCRAIEEPVRVPLEGLAQARVEGGVLGVARAVGEAGREGGWTRAKAATASRIRPRKASLVISARATARMPNGSGRVRPW